MGSLASKLSRAWSMSKVAFFLSATSGFALAFCTSSSSCIELEICRNKGEMRSEIMLVIL
jgi:hypothetical protein